MRNKFIVVSDSGKMPIVAIGRIGEDEATQIKFDLSEYVNMFGDGSPVLVMQLAGESEPFPITTTFEDGILSWLVEDEELAVPGLHHCEIRYVVGDVIAKTKIFGVMVEDSLNGEIEPPSEYGKDWMTQVTKEVEAQKDKIATDEETLTDHETRIKALEDGGGSGVDAYTKTETDALLKQKQDVLTEDDKQSIADMHSDKVTSVNGQTGDVIVQGGSEDNNLSGKKWLAFGDSITGMQYNYARVVAETYGATLDRSARGGMSVSYCTNYCAVAWFEGTSSTGKFNYDDDYKPDLITINFGVNDGGAVVAGNLGSLSDDKVAQSASSYSFYGCYCRLIRDIYAKWGFVPIYLMTQPANTSDKASRIAYDLKIRNAIIEIGAYFGLPVFDLFGMTEYQMGLASNVWTVDGTHPTPKAINHWAKQLGMWLNDIEASPLSLAGYSVTHNLDNVTTGLDIEEYVVSGDEWKEIVYANSGYTLDSVSVTMGDVDITSEAWNASTGYIDIPSVTGAIVITATATADAGYWSITNTLTNVTTSNDATQVVQGASYSATLTADEGYDLSTVTVTMGGEDVTSDVYSTGTITISSVTGDLVITATAEEPTEQPVFSVVNTDCTGTPVDTGVVWDGTSDISIVLKASDIVRNSGYVYLLSHMKDIDSVRTGYDDYQAWLSGTKSIAGTYTNPDTVVYTFSVSDGCWTRYYYNGTIFTSAKVAKNGGWSVPRESSLTCDLHWWFDGTRYNGDGGTAGQGATFHCDFCYIFDSAISAEKAKAYLDE